MKQDLGRERTAPAPPLTATGKSRQERHDKTGETHDSVEARVDAQHSRVRRLVEDCQELRRQQEISEVVHGEVGLQAVRRHFSGLRRAAMGEKRGGEGK